MISIFLKGLWIGGTLSVPGVSGGTMAMLIGIYEPLVRSINILISKSDKKKEAFWFLALFSAGALLGIISISSIVLNLLEMAPMPMIFLFAGAIAGGIPMIWKEIKKEQFSRYNFFYLFIGLLMVLFISYLPESLFDLEYSGGFIMIIKQVFAGLIAAFALILPGISVSHMLLILGMYQGILDAISSFSFLKLLPFIIGAALGIILFSRLVDFCFVRFRAPTYLLILGFVLGSVFDLLGNTEWNNFSFICLPLFLIGYSLIYLISKKRTDT